MAAHIGRWPIIVLVGQTNSGKSSLFNRLLDRLQVVVAYEPGTTRDPIMEALKLGPVKAWLVDSAGFKNPDNQLEASLQAQLADLIEQADIIVLVVDGQLPVLAPDRKLATLALKNKKPLILAVNKSDKKDNLNSSRWASLRPTLAVSISCQTKAGIDQLKNHLTTLVADRAEFDQSLDPDQAYPVALIGRPNVGKSSLFNYLLKRSQALVADQPGTTRDTNRQLLSRSGQIFYLADTAGLKKPGKMSLGLEKFSGLKTLAAINQAEVCLLVLSAPEMVVSLDQRLAGLIKTAAKGLLVLVNKWDQLPESASSGPGLQLFQDRLRQEFAFVPWLDWLPVSAVSGFNLDQIMDRVGRIRQVRDQQFNLNRLNTWLRQVVNQQPPPGRVGRKPRLGYICQVGQAPPAFQFFGRNLNRLHWSYRRFLENQFRSQFQVQGTALVFKFVNQTQPVEAGALSRSKK